MREANFLLKIQKLCSNCASHEHRFDNCPHLFEECTYHHSFNNLQPHSVLMCPLLHSACLQCKVCGHQERDHDFGNTKSPRQLRLQFIQFAHFGLWSSIPYLHPQKELQNYHWTAAMGMNRLPKNAADFFLYTGLKGTMPKEAREKVQHQMKTTTDNLTADEQTYINPNQFDKY